MIDVRTVGKSRVLKGTEANFVCLSLVTSPGPLGLGLLRPRFATSHDLLYERMREAELQKRQHPNMEWTSSRNAVDSTIVKMRARIFAQAFDQKVCSAWLKTKGPEIVAVSDLAILGALLTASVFGTIWFNPVK